MLVGRGALAGMDLLLFDRLRRLHAQVAHATDWGPSPDVAARYAGMARPLIGRFVQDTRPIKSMRQSDRQTS